MGGGGESSLSGVWFICATQVLINDNSGTQAENKQWENEGK